MKLQRVLVPSLPQREEDPRLGEVMSSWDAPLEEVPAGRPVFVGFPQDEGVRRNGGRPGAAEAPQQLRNWLHRLVRIDPVRGVDLASLQVIDVGDVQVSTDLEASQADLAGVLAVLLRRQCVPLVLGGGHETAYGIYLGYVEAQVPMGVVNVDAHLDVRPTLAGLGHSGSPFRQAMEHERMPLCGSRYSCFGAQPFAVSRLQAEYVQSRGGTIRWCSEVTDRLVCEVRDWLEKRDSQALAMHLSIDADVVEASTVPGVSAPNPVGLRGAELLSLAYAAGTWQSIRSMELVEINPSLDRDGSSARWGALVIWHFLCGLAERKERVGSL